jgi:malate dehydrogenase (oxaloacetate-decarboxylating)
MRQLDSISSQEAAQKFWLIDKYGLITDKLKEKGLVRDDLEDFIRPVSEFSESIENPEKIGLLDVVKRAKPTVLIGCSTHARGFTEEVIRAMKEHCERPIIFPLSNPSKLVEVDPKDANDWTDGMALIATGSPFPPVKAPNGKDYMCVFSNDMLTCTRADCPFRSIAECNSMCSNHSL